ERSTRDDCLDPWRVGQDLRYPWSGRNNMLKVVEDEQQLPSVQVLAEPPLEGLVAGILQPELVRDRRNNQGGVADRGERDEPGTIRKRVQEGPRNLDGEAALARPACA